MIFIILTYTQGMLYREANVTYYLSNVIDPENNITTNLGGDGKSSQVYVCFCVCVCVCSVF